MTAPRLIALASVAAALTPALASANVPKYRASIEGTFTSRSTITQTCDDGRAVTGGATETATFRTTRAATIFVQRLGHSYPAIALVDTRKPIVATASIERASSLASGDETTSCAGEPDPTGCGAKTLRFELGMSPGRKGVAPNFEALPVAGSRSPFKDCPLLFGQTGFPSMTPEEAGTAKISAARLLNARKLVLHGRGHGSDRDSAVDGSSSYDVKYTIRLVRVRT